jgi:uncharacterized protein YbgA (DUF1722 family)
MKYMNTTATAVYFGLSAHTLKVWRNGNGKTEPTLIEGIHWVRRSERAILYNVTLLEDWIVNHKTNPEAHQRAIDAYLRSLPSNHSNKQKSPDN